LKTIDKQFYISLGLRIKDAREKKGYSLNDLANKINLLIDKNNLINMSNPRKHILRQTIGKIELGKSRIGTDLYFDICDALEIEHDEMIKRTNSNNVDQSNVKEIKTKSGIKIIYNKKHQLSAEDIVEINKTIIDEIK
jgi:transcriptional regulator with XRE-family HTH domain